MINTAKKLNLLPLPPPSRLSTSASAPKVKVIQICLVPSSFWHYLHNNKLLVGVEPIQHLFIRDPEHGIFYLDRK